MNKIVLLAGAAVMYIMSFAPHTDGFYSAAMVLLWMGMACRDEQGK